ncbi:NAD(P)-binding domain-containing protein [Archangium violaceum]|uniref:NADPH-dependent F420 reductase n=1 Tax=Archangium violaceum TaxID=83451 RepID=UPI0019520E42|nr:NAD(P)-binding domain-containing protein [Archangium violaceum]QRN93543.1 NAD(P)-binding domain-containing protein [Archangium violaceum]
MSIGIIGAGSIGQALAGHMAKIGHEVIVSNSRGPESLGGLVRQLGPRARAGTRQEAAKADLVMFSVPWEQVPEALSGLPAWNGRILVDATNPVLLPGFRLAELGGKTSSEVVASLAPGARVVKAANTLLAAVLAADPRQSGGRRVLFMSGDDAPAKAEVGELFGKAGFAAVDLGELAIGGRSQQFPGGPLATLNLIKLD